VTFRTATEVVIACENTLGFTPDTTRYGLDQARRIEAGKLNKKMKADPSITFEQLEYALAYSFRKREPVKSPAALCFRIKAALEEAAELEVQKTDLSLLVEAALAWEMAQPVLNEGWIGKLTRSQGDARKDLLTNWKESGRG
jgi:hypothetical protein